MRGLELKLNQAKLTLNRGKRVPTTSCYFLQEDEQMLNRLYGPLGWDITQVMSCLSLFLGTKDKVLLPCTWVGTPALLPITGCLGIYVEPVSLQAFLWNFENWYWQMSSTTDKQNDSRHCSERYGCPNFVVVALSLFIFEKDSLQRPYQLVATNFSTFPIAFKV